MTTARESRSTTKLPNVLYIGMGKSGSTLIYKMMLRHPDIFVSDDFKELNFFGNNKRWRDGIGWYENCFRNYNGERFIADISPGYHIKDMTRERMVDVLGTNLKIIFTFRRFTDFAFSRYLQKVRSRRVPHSFLHELEVMGNFYRPLDDIIEKYVETFGRENLLIMEYEKDFVRGAPKFEPQIYDFLGLDSSQSYYDASADTGVNKGYVPRFAYAGPQGLEETRDGVVYRVPANTLVYCNGRGYQNKSWKDPSKAVLDEQRAVEAEWTTEMTPELYDYVQQKYTLPLAQRIKDRLGINLDYWEIEPKRIAYEPAPLPDAYIVNPDGVALEQTPWG